MKNERVDNAFVSGMGAGFDTAIRALYAITKDESNGGVTKCLHAYEWAQYLEQVKDSEISNMVQKIEDQLNG